MSYANVAATNAPPPSVQPHPDPALLNTSKGSTGLPDVEGKVHVVPSDFKRNPHTETSEARIASSSDDEERNIPGSAKRRARKERERAERALRQANKKGWYLWEVTKERILRPSVAGGMMGIVNIALLSYIGHEFYTKPELRSDTRIVTGSIIGTLILFSGEGYIAESYLESPEGQAEQRRVKEEGSLIYRRSREVILRPGVLGGLVGLVNVGILGGLGYVGYTNWDKPSWDRRTVSAVSVGLIALFTGEGYLAETYMDKGYHKHK